MCRRFTYFDVRQKKWKYSQKYVVAESNDQKNSMRLVLSLKILQHTTPVTLRWGVFRSSCSEVSGTLSADSRVEATNNMCLGAHTRKKTYILPGSFRVTAIYSLLLSSRQIKANFGCPLQNSGLVRPKTKQYYL